MSDREYVVGRCPLPGTDLNDHVFVETDQFHELANTHMGVAADKVRSSNPIVQTRHELARRLNRAVDRALLNEGNRTLADLLELSASEKTMALCSRIARRAALAACHQQDVEYGPCCRPG